jgi:hypothetical protein
VRAADESLPAASAASLFLKTPVAAPSAPAGEFPIELQAAPSGTTGKVTPGASDATAPAKLAPAEEPPAPASTPLLDAAIQRVADVTRQQREAIAASPDPIDDQSKRRVIGPPTTILAAAPKRDQLEKKIPEPVATLSPVPKQDRLEEKKPKPTTKLSPAPKGDQPEEKKPEKTPEKPEKTPVLPDPTRPPSGDRPSGIVAEVKASPEHRPLLRISDLQLCRKVFGFGSFEPLADRSVKVGQHLLIYCELTGLQYEARDAGFVSRISSRIEIKPALGGPALWEQELGAAEDLCRRQRRDYYVNYRIDLPRTLGPGAYTLRFLQTDLVAGCSTTTEIPLEITP